MNFRHLLSCDTIVLLEFPLSPTEIYKKTDVNLECINLACERSGGQLCF